MNIRNFKQEDFPMIKSWWNTANEEAPIATMLPEDSTFILEIDKTPVLAITVYLTNSKEMAFLENFVGNPEYKGEARKQASQLIVDHARNYAKGLGYKRVICFAYKDKLKKRYQELGMRKTVDNLTAFVKELN